MSLYNFNYYDLIKTLLPSFMRKAKMVEWLFALVSPIDKLYKTFRANRDTRLLEIRRTSQLTHMEAVLNDRWDAGLRRIKIVDGNTFVPLYIYLTAEQKTPTYIFKESEGKPKYLYNNNEVDSAGIDFIVEVPNFIIFDQAEMIALVNKYRLPSKVYLIQQV